MPTQKQPFDELFESQVVQPSAAYRAAIGEAVHLNSEGFLDLLSRLRNYHRLYPGMAFWVMIRHKDLTLLASDGDESFFGRKLETVKELYRVIHPEYLMPFLRWRSAAYELVFRRTIKIEPLEMGYRQTVPMRAKDGEYHWFAMYSTIAQLDANGRIVTNLQTYYREGKWSARNLRPFEANIILKNLSDPELDRSLIGEISLSLIDEFTNAELDLLSMYGSGKTGEEVQRIKSWSRHTLHEYNANLLKKAKSLFVYDFRNAREFAEYCLEKGFIHPR